MENILSGIFATTTVASVSSNDADGNQELSKHLKVAFLIMRICDDMFTHEVEDEDEEFESNGCATVRIWH